jgi:hypothetical protein
VRACCGPCTPAHHGGPTADASAMRGHACPPRCLRLSGGDGACMPPHPQASRRRTSPASRAPTTLRRCSRRSATVRAPSWCRAAAARPARRLLLLGVLLCACWHTHLLDPRVRVCVCVCVCVCVSRLPPSPRRRLVLHQPQARVHAGCHVPPAQPQRRGVSAPVAERGCSCGTCESSPDRPRHLICHDTQPHHTH